MVMAKKVIVVLNSFKSGELTPRLDVRTDLDIYEHGCKKLINAIIRQQGGIRKRGGTKFIYEAGG
jgi:hypothetical protein